MVTVNQILNKVLVYTGRPTEESLPLPDVLEVLYGRIDYYRTQLGIANRNWLVGKFILDVDSSTDEYEIASRAPDFARPFYIETYDESLPNFQRSPVKVADIQDANLVARDIVNPTGFNMSAYFKHTAQVIEFWGYESNDIKCRVIPQPTMACQYQVWYETGKAADPLPADSPLLMPEFHDLLAVHTASLCIARCKWYDIKDNPGATAQELQQLNNAEYQKHDKTIAGALMLGMAQFEMYRRSNKHERATLRRAFNSYRGRGRSNWNRR